MSKSKSIFLIKELASGEYYEDLSLDYWTDDDEIKHADNNIYLTSNKDEAKVFTTRELAERCVECICTYTGYYDTEDFEIIEEMVCTRNLN